MEAIERERSTVLVAAIAVVVVTGFVPLSESATLGPREPVEDPADATTSFSPRSTDDIDPRQDEPPAPIETPAPRTPADQRRPAAPDEARPSPAAIEARYDRASELVSTLEAGSSSAQDLERTLHHREEAGHANLSSADLTKQRTAIEIARALTEDPATAQDAAVGSVRATEHLARWQASHLDGSPSEAIPLAGHEEPSEALAELADRYDVPLPPTQADLARLDALPGPAAEGLARTVDAYLALDRATEQAYADADVEALTELAQRAGRPTPPVPQADAEAAFGPTAPAQDDPRPPRLDPAIDVGSVLAEADLDVSFLLAQRAELVDAVASLQQAVADAGAAREGCATVKLPPAVAIDGTGCDDTYTENYALVVDVGGNDTYHNNAGGSKLVGDECDLPSSPPGGAAALVDLDAGDDEHGDPDEPRACGVNGGGHLGVGFLYDEAGDDDYVAGSGGTNGGGALGGLGLLVDARGSDEYVGGRDGTNGGGDLGALGLLVDGGGDDTLEATDTGTNGGANFAAVGALVLSGGDDRVSATHQGTNGGAVTGAAGLLVEGEGNTSFVAGDLGTNGGAHAAHALLFSEGGDDRFDAGSQGTNGGGVYPGTAGTLLDLAGDDNYTAGSWGANGGGDLNGAGLLVDADGDDEYTAGSGGTNGGSSFNGIGSLVDGNGTDRYEDAYLPGGVCEDCTVVFKGTYGQQLDTDEPPLAVDRPTCPPGDLHPPVQIHQDEGPAGFAIEDPRTGRTHPRPASGVTSGSGTAEDPYVIEDLCTYAAAGGGVPGIWIRGTEAHVVVRNTTVVGAGPLGSQGILVEGAANVTLEDNLVTHASRGIALQDARHVEVRNNTARHGGDGILAEGSHHVLVHENTLRLNDLDGAFLDGGHNVTVDANRIATNFGVGVRALYADDVTVEGNRIERPGNHGAYIGAAERPLVANNTVEEARSGLVLPSSPNATLLGNEIRDSAWAGIWVGGDDWTIRDNRIRRSGGYGVGTSFFGTERGHLEGNVIEGSHWAGVDLLRDDHVLVHDNTITNTSALTASILDRGYGIDAMSSTNVTITNTTIADADYVVSPGGADNLTVANSTLTGSRLAVLAAGLQHGRIQNNSFADNDVDVYEWSSENLRVDDNTFEAGVLLRDRPTSLTGNTVQGDPIVSIHGEDDPHIPDEAGQILVHASTNVSIADRSFEGVATPVIVTDSEHVTVTNVTARDAFIGTYVAETTGFTVENATIAGGERMGLYLWADDGTVRGNTVTDVDSSGVFASGANLTLAGNRIEEGFAGIAAYGDNATVRSNTLVGHEGPGLELDASDAVVEDNLVRDNGRGPFWEELTTGITVEEPRALIANNTITDNPTGVYLDGPADNATIHSSVVTGNDVGVLAGDRRGSPGDVTLEGTTIAGNAEAGLLLRNPEGTLDARDNWWGHASGPSGGEEDACTDAVADGEGDRIAVEDEDVLQRGPDICFEPWLASPNPQAGAG